MEEKYQLKEGCLTIQMPKELDHHEAGRLKMEACLLYTSPSPRDGLLSRMPSSA